DSEVIDIKTQDDFIQVITNKGEYRTRFLVNAAGVYGGIVAKMYGEKVKITPRKGEYLLYDQAVSQVLSHTVFQTPSKMGKGILVTPTVEGNLLLGPTSENIEDKDDFSTTRSGLKSVLDIAKKSVPDLDLKGVITSFAGLRAVPEGGDFIIRPSETNPHIIDCIGIESPGLSSSPAIGEYVLELLQKAGLKTQEKKDYQSKNKRRLRFAMLSDEERAKAVENNPKYGHIVCRCETVTEGEIIDAIHRPAGATTVDGVKHRTRAGAGRCHGGFCGPAVMQILARELDIPMEEVRRTDDGSWIVNKKTKA
ncbi:MAG: FAD-dependent oxidoreductase, partial [Eubacteriales bacterium]